MDPSSCNNLKSLGKRTDFRADRVGKHTGQYQVFWSHFGWDRQGVDLIPSGENRILLVCEHQPLRQDGYDKMQTPARIDVKENWRFLDIKHGS